MSRRADASGAGPCRDDRFDAQGEVGIGATIMGRDMFGPTRGLRGTEAWRGWWADKPPFHHPMFVLTHHPQPPITMEGGTTFHFVSDGIEAALERTFQAADGGADGHECVELISSTSVVHARLVRAAG